MHINATISTLETVSREARRDDALTLWYLLSRLQADEETAVYDCLAALSPPLPGIARDGILARDETMLRAWSQKLDVFW